MTVRTAALVLDIRAYVAAVAQTIATVPDGEVWLIRSLSLRNGSAVLGSTFLVLQRRSGTDFILERQLLGVGAGVTLVERYHAFEAGDAVRMQWDQAITGSLVMSGARLVT